jgi:hypothetical protein
LGNEIERIDRAFIIVFITDGYIWEVDDGMCCCCVCTPDLACNEFVSPQLLDFISGERVKPFLKAYR